MITIACIHASLHRNCCLHSSLFLYLEGRTWWMPPTIHWTAGGWSHLVDSRGPVGRAQPPVPAAFQSHTLPVECSEGSLGWHKTSHWRCCWALAILPGASWTSKGLSWSPVGRSPLFYTVYSVGKWLQPHHLQCLLLGKRWLGTYLMRAGDQSPELSVGCLFRIQEFTVLLVNDYIHPWPWHILGETV